MVSMVNLYPMQVFITVETILASLLVVVLVGVILSPLLAVVYVALLIVSYCIRLLPLEWLRDFVRQLLAPQ